MTSPSPHRDDSWLGDQWRLFRVSRPSALLIGSGHQIEPIIQSITSYGGEPVVNWPDAAGEPTPAAAPFTLLVRDVDLLDLREQNRLNLWLGERSGTVRAIATSKVELYTLVERAQFLESLYYRLNVVCLDTDALTVTV